MTQDNPVDVTAYQYKIGTTTSAWKNGTAGRQVTLQEILGTTPAFNTTYQIQVRVRHEGVDQNWGWVCSVTTPASIAISDDVIIDLDDVGSKSLIEIYPNPVLDEVAITFNVNTTSLDAQLAIYDLQGRKIVTIVSGQLPEGQYTYVKDLGSLAQGMYVINLSLDTQNPINEKLIKQ
jgi:hypothetical protein